MARQQEPTIEVAEAQVRLKAIKLFEAATEPHEPPMDSGDHEWRECRHCLAIEELETKTGHVLMVTALKALRSVAALCPPSTEDRT